MKVRQGFISNSSTTSFCIYGACIDESEFVEKVKKFYANNTKIAKMIKSYDAEQEGCEDGEECEESNDTDYFDMYELSEAVMKVSNLDITIDGENSSVWVGRQWQSIGGDETGNQFKKDVEFKLKDIFGISKKDIGTQDVEIA